MEKRKITRSFEVIEYGDKCTHCGRYIKGNSESQAMWNLAVHIMRNHSKEVLNKKEVKK